MTLKREIKDAYIENGHPVYIKTHSNAVYVDENEAETLTQRLANVKGKIDNNTSQLNQNVNDINIIKTYYAKKTDVNELASNKADKDYVDNIANTKADKADLTNPFVFKGSCLSSKLPSSANVNDTWYCTDLKYRKTWNGSAWYQSSMDEVDYTDELEKIEESLGNSSNGTLIANDQYLNISNKYISEPRYNIFKIDVSNKNKILINSIKIDNLAGWGFYETDSSNSMISTNNAKTFFGDTEMHTSITLDIPEGAKYLKITSKTTSIECRDVLSKSIENIYQSFVKYKNIDNEIKPLLIDEEKYIKNDGSTVSFTGKNVYTFDVRNTKKVYLENVFLANISAVCFYTDNMIFISGRSSREIFEDTKEHTTIEINDFPKTAKYLKISGNSDCKCYSVIVNEANEVNILPSISMFESIGIIGDSYASGELWKDDSTVLGDFYNISWGQILGRKNGIDVTNFSVGGLTTRSWLTSAKGLALLQSQSAKNLYYFGLGINDVYSILSSDSSYIGSIDDIQTKSDTFYGNVAKIIESVKSKAPKSRIIISDIANRYDGKTYWQKLTDKINNALEEIANYYNIPFVSQSNSDYFNSAFYCNNMVGGHPTSISYACMATEIQNLIEKAIKDNADYFLNYPQ